MTSFWGLFEFMEFILSKWFGGIKGGLNLLWIRMDSNIPIRSEIFLRVPSINSLICETCLVKSAETIEH